MFTHGDFKAIFYTRPFRPFRIFLRDGRVVVRDHPGNMIASAYLGATVGIPSQSNPDIADGVERFEYEDVARVEIDGAEYQPGSANQSNESTAA